VIKMSVMDRMMGGKFKELEQALIQRINQIEKDMNKVNNERLQANQAQLLEHLKQYKQDIRRMTREIILEEFDKRIMQKIEEAEYNNVE